MFLNVLHSKSSHMDISWHNTVLLFYFLQTVGLQCARRVADTCMQLHACYRTHAAVYDAAITHNQVLTSSFNTDFLNHAYVHTKYYSQFWTTEYFAMYAQVKSDPQGLLLRKSLEAATGEGKYFLTE